MEEVKEYYIKLLKFMYAWHKQHDTNGTRKHGKKKGTRRVLNVERYVKKDTP